MQSSQTPLYRFTILVLLASIFFSYTSLVFAETSDNKDSNPVNQAPIMASKKIQLPAPLLEKIHTLCTKENFDEALALAIAERMFALNETLKPLNDEDAIRTAKDRHTSFLDCRTALR